MKKFILFIVAFLSFSFVAEAQLYHGAKKLKKLKEIGQLNMVDSLIIHNAGVRIDNGVLIKSTLEVTTFVTSGITATGRIMTTVATEQLRLRYDATNYATWTVAADGALTIATVDAAAAAGDINLNPDGFVGVLTAAPTVALDVTGAIKASGTISAATYGSDGSVLDAELLYINTLSSNAQDQIDAISLTPTVTFDGNKGAIDLVRFINDNDGAVGDSSSVFNKYGQLISSGVGATTNNTFADTIDVVGEVKANTFVVDATEDFSFTSWNSGAALGIESQTSSSGFTWGLFTKDGDGTDGIDLSMYGVGTISSTAVRERLIWQWSTARSRYEMWTESQGGGSVLRPLALYTEGNTDQILLEIDGDVLLGSGGKLTVDGQKGTINLLELINDNDGAAGGDSGSVFNKYGHLISTSVSPSGVGLNHSLADTIAVTGAYESIGTASDLTLSPAFKMMYTGDDNAVFHFFGFSHDNLALVFDAWHDGTQWVSSDAGSNYWIYKTTDKLSIRADDGIAAGSAATPVDLWNINKNGNVQQDGTLTVDGTGASAIDGQLTINDTGGDKDFRVETAGEDSALVVDGADGDVFMEGLGSGTGTFLVRVANTDEIVELNGAPVFAAYTRHVDIQAAGATQGGTAPTATTVGTARGLGFAADAEVVHFEIEVPTDWDGASNMTLKVQWFPTSGDAVAQSETVKWDATYRSIAEGEAIDNGSVVIATATFTGGASETDKEYYITDITIVYTGGNQPLAMSDVIVFQFDRDVGVDDYSGSGIVIGWELEYTSIALPLN